MFVEIGGGYGQGVVTFAVDAVEPVMDRLPAVRLDSLCPDALAVGGDPGREVLAPHGVHPLLGAVGRAFAEHRPLVLSPDAVWLTIAQGLAQHVRLHADQLRPYLVGHAGRRRLAVTMPGAMPQDADAWAHVVETSAKQLDAEVDDADLFGCDFTTSTSVERTAARVVLLDAYSPYFTYWLMCVCGIPTITLTGTVADWQKIRDRIEHLPRFGLDTWQQSLAPITDQFVRAADGYVDVDFWRRIYNPADAYGGPVITGWAARLYPYLLSQGKIDRPNPLLDLPIDQPRDLTDPAASDRMGYRGPGIRSDDVPATLSHAVINVNDQVSGDNRAVALHAGLIAVTQHPDGALEPVAGWHLTLATPHIDDVVPRLTDHGEISPPPTEPSLVFMLPAEAAPLYQQIGSASLFDGAWHLLPIADHRHTHLSDDYATGLIGIAELPDGRTLTAVTRDGNPDIYWAVCRINPGEGSGKRWQVDDDAADIPLFGTSLAMILDAALDTGGGIAHLETGRLSDLL